MQPVADADGVALGVAVPVAVGDCDGVGAPPYVGVGVGLTATQKPLRTRFVSMTYVMGAAASGSKARRGPAF